MSEKASKHKALSAPDAPFKHPCADAARFEALMRDQPGQGMPDSEALDDDGGFWVFAYGSLLWNPGVDFDDRQDAVLEGFERTFCLWSLRYRGTPAAPGLLLGIRPHDGAETSGAAFHVPAERAQDGLAHLRDRELITNAYLEKKLPLRVSTGGRETIALAYVIDVGHLQYAGGMDREQQARIIANCAGTRGSNAEYLFNTMDHFRETGVRGADVDEMYELEELVKRFIAAG